MSEIKRNRNESFESFMRRVKKRWQQSGKMQQVRKIQFFQSKKSRNMQRKSAIHRLTIAEKRAYLEKIGQLPEDPRRR